MANLNNTRKTGDGRGGNGEGSGPAGEGERSGAIQDSGRYIGIDLQYDFNFLSIGHQGERRSHVLA